MTWLDWVMLVFGLIAIVSSVWSFFGILLDLTPPLWLRRVFGVKDWET